MTNAKPATGGHMARSSASTTTCRSQCGVKAVSFGIWPDGLEQGAVGRASTTKVGYAISLSLIRTSTAFAACGSPSHDPPTLPGMYLLPATQQRPMRGLWLPLLPGHRQSQGVPGRWMHPQDQGKSGWAEKSILPTIKKEYLMSKPRYRWWGYVKAMVRAYPGSPPQSCIDAKEHAAVESALEQTRGLPDGADRIRMVGMVFFDQTHTLEGAALVLSRSPRTIRRWHTSFILLVAKNFGLL